MRTFFRRLIRLLIKIITEVFKIMKLPVLNRKAAGELKIADFSGGVNLRDGLSEIMDNQATDVKNMWWKDGIMKTRPADRSVYKIPYDGFKPFIAGQTFTNSKAENATKMIDGRLYNMVSRHDSYYSKVVSEEPWMPEQSHISFAWVNGEKNYPLPSITTGENTAAINYFAVQHKKDIYCFVYLEDYGGDKSGVIYRLADDESGWSIVPEEDIYAPVVMTHARPQRDIVVKIEEVLADGGVLFEGYNLVCNRYKMIYSMINKDLDTSEKTHAIGYALAAPLSEKLNGQKVFVKITNKNGLEYNHSVTINVNDQVPYMIEQEDVGDGLYLGIRNNYFSFYNGPNIESGIALINVADYDVQDNMEINAPYDITDEETKKVFGMTRSVWFGSDALGISGGTRLFLCGNTEEDEKSLVCWSGLDNPLYFPENCYAYVGNSNQAVTAFGRQNDTLVIFKERETYYTQYMRNDDITAEDLINQSVVDYTASSVYFPIVQLHPAIGCDCPDTVQLCRNRLVWACTDGSVYTLMTQNQYSERNIYAVSEMVRPRLQKETGLNNACACDWDGHYLLCAGNRIYVMDYESYGYTYASSYGKTEDANIRIPWWIWELPRNIGGSLVLDGKAVLWGLAGEGVPEDISLDFGGFDAEYTADTDADGNETPIESSFTTKLFDFGAPHTRKNIDGISAAFGENSGEPITAGITTDEGFEEHILSLQGGENQNRQAGYTESRLIVPEARQITRLQAGFSCRGTLAIDALAIKYRLTGGNR